jgi:hypothetical protein
MDLFLDEETILINKYADEVLALMQSLLDSLIYNDIDFLNDIIYYHDKIN